MAQDPPLLFCFGLGFSALGVARTLRAKGWQIAGTSRNPATLTHLAAQGVDTFRFDTGAPLADPEILWRADAILSSVAPDQSGDPVLDAHGPQLAATKAWLGYISTTGVYGDAGGAWIDETAERRAKSDRGLRRIAAEDRWHDLGAEIFRAAGIYGPGRSQIDTVRAGTARRLIKPGQVFSRIHVDDLGNIIAAAIAHPHRGAVYNAADDEPAPPQTVVAYAARLLACPPPPEENFFDAAPSLSPMARSFYDDNKRIDNRRAKRVLGLTLKYPTYRQGLAACLSAGPGSKSRTLNR